MRLLLNLVTIPMQKCDFNQKRCPLSICTIYTTGESGHLSISPNLYNFEFAPNQY